MGGGGGGGRGKGRVGGSKEERNAGKSGADAVRQDCREKKVMTLFVFCSDDLSPPSLSSLRQIDAYIKFLHRCGSDLW